MVELRLDLMELSNEQVKQLLQQCVEAVVTFREGKYTEVERQQALMAAISNGASYVDVEVEADETYRNTIVQHAQQNGCKVIISYHNFDSTPDTATLRGIIQQCRAMGADIVKLITTAKSAADCSRVLSLYEDEHDLVTFAMGEEGKISRLACLFLGAPFTYASAAKGSEAAPGQLAAKDMEQAIQLIHPTDSKLFAVTGNPILHSRSPLLFNGAYSNTLKKYPYFRMAAESGIEAIQVFRELGLKGMNVTAPFKSAIAMLADHRSEEVTILQAANTLAEKNGELYAYNTDILGVTGALKSANINLAQKQCLVVGAGGAGCAAAYALVKEGAKVTIVNRTADKAKAFAQKVGCSYSGLDELKELLQNADVLINTLSSNVDVIDEQWLKPKLVVLDAQYHNSALQQRAISRGCTYIDGSQWLLHQGIPSYRIFTGIEPDIHGMATALSDTTKIPKHISFIGFMGSGKSTIAPIVAQKLGMPVVDVDLELEKRHGESIPQMIGSKGEPYFREKERELLKELLSNEKPLAISCGGGAITQPEMSDMLKKESIVIYLHASPSECLKRIDASSRPLLAQHKNPLKVATELFEKRKELYLKTAWLLVNTNNRTVEQVSKIVYDEICKCIGG